jgi:hypothetical protein
LGEALTDLEIVPSALGQDAGPIGAAALFLDRLELDSLESSAAPVGDRAFLVHDGMDAVAARAAYGQRIGSEA